MHLYTECPINGNRSVTIYDMYSFKYYTLDFVLIILALHLSLLKWTGLASLTWRLRFQQQRI